MPVRYRIRFKGHLDPTWSTWFDGLTIAHEANGETVLAGPLHDQAALYGILEKARNLNLTLVSLGELPSTTADDSQPAGVEQHGPGFRTGAPAKGPAEELPVEKAVDCSDHLYQCTGGD